MKRTRRRPIEEFSMSFLDVISCGFGAVILLLMITKTVEPVLLEQSMVRLEGVVEMRRDAIFEIRGQTVVLTRELKDAQRELTEELQQLAQLQRELSIILGQYAATKDKADDDIAKESQLASAKQSLTDEMERLLGTGFQRTDNTIAGITVDSEYIIFVIDTSGSMFNFAWQHVMQKVSETLAIYPEVKGIQVMNDMGDYMFSRYAGRWIPDSRARRRAIMERLRTWNPFSNSSPVEGIQRAVQTYSDPDKRISVYVFGDDFTGRSIEAVVDTVDRINAPDASGRRPVRIHAVGFPTLFQAAPNRQATLYRFAALMRELTRRNNGTFVGLAEFQ
jgi:hypothetical protein